MIVGDALGDIVMGESLMAKVGDSLGINEGSVDGSAVGTSEGELLGS
jgi:hypothetical protein